MKLLTNEFYHEIGSRAIGVHVDEPFAVNCKRQITRQATESGSIYGIRMLYKVLQYGIQKF